MSGRYWLSLIAAIGLTASFAHAQGVGNDAGSKPSATQSASQPRPDAPPTIPISVQNDIKSIARALETANDKQPSQDEEDRAKRDLTAQEDMAFWASLMFGATVLGIFLSGAGVWLIYGTLIQTRNAATAARDAVTVTRDIGEAQVRAYLHVKSLTVSFLHGLERPGFAAIITNSGQSPAREVVCSAQVWYLGRHFGQKSRPAPNWQQAVGKAIPAGSDEEVPADTEEMQFSVEARNAAREPGFGIFMQARVMFKYRDVFKQEWEGDAYFNGFVTPDETANAVFDSQYKTTMTPVRRPQRWEAKQQS
jgi:hypothetical protein